MNVSVGVGEVLDVIVDCVGEVMLLNVVGVKRNVICITVVMCVTVLPSEYSLHDSGREHKEAVR